MKRDFKTYLKLFASTFTVSAFTFGGGFVIIPLLRKKFAEGPGGIDEEELLDLTAIAQSSPGAVAVNASVLIGYRIAGIRGALAAILGTVLPPFIILSAVSLFYNAFKNNTAVSLVLKAMQAGVAAVIADVVISMAADIIKEKRLMPVFIMIAAFILSYFLKINVIYIIVICGITGMLNTFERNDGKK